MNGSGVDKRREIEDVEDGRWKGAISMKDKEKEEVMMVPKIVQLKVMRKVKKVNRMKQVKKGIEYQLKRISKRETAVNSDEIDDVITKVAKSTTDQVKKVPSGLEETFNLTQLTPELNDRKEIKSLIDVVRFPDEAVDRVVDAMQEGIESIVPEQVKKVRQEVEDKAVEVLQPFIENASRLFSLNPSDDQEITEKGTSNDSKAKTMEILQPFIESASRLFNLNPSTDQESTSIEKESSNDTPSFPSLFSKPQTKTRPSDSGLFHVFRGVLG